MARSAASAVWTVVGVVAAILVGLAVLFGPRLYREGRQLVGPITDLARAEKEMAALDRDLPFTPPADGMVSEARLQVFFQIRRDLVPHYQRWEVLSREVEARGDSQSWSSAKEVLAAVRDVLAVQTALLRQHGMSAAEFRWLERQVYDDWFESLGSTEVDLRLRRSTEEDLRFVTELGARHGRSQALAEIERRLEARLADLASAPTADAGGGPNSALFGQHRDEIAELDLSAYAEMHARMRQGPGEDFKVHLGDESEDRALVIGGREPEATPTP